MDNIDVIVSSDCEMIRLWRINLKLSTKLLMYNDTGNVDHLPTYLPIVSHILIIYYHDTIVIYMICHLWLVLYNLLL
jgi:hypothetical protein